MRVLYAVRVMLTLTDETTATALCVYVNQTDCGSVRTE